MSDARADLAAQTFGEQYPCLDERARRTFMEAIQALQLQTFLLRGGAIRMDHRYAFVEKYEDLIAAYLAIGGWRLHLDREQGVARLFHPEGSGRVRFNKEETIVIFCLRLLYHEERQKASESLERAVSVGILREKLHSLLPAAQVKTFLSRRTMGRILRRLEFFRLIEFEGASFVIHDDTLLSLKPALEYLVSSRSLEETEARLKALSQAGALAEEMEAPEALEAPEAEASMEN